MKPSIPQIGPASGSTEERQQNKPKTSHLSNEPRHDDNDADYANSFSSPEWEVDLYPDVAKKPTEQRT